MSTNIHLDSRRFLLEPNHFRVFYCTKYRVDVSQCLNVRYFSTFNGVEDLLSQLLIIFKLSVTCLFALH